MNETKTETATELPVLPEGFRWSRGLSITGAPVINLQERRKSRFGGHKYKTIDYTFIRRETNEYRRCAGLLLDRAFTEAWKQRLGPVE